MLGLTALPGGSPGPNANIPAPWKLIIILVALVAVAIFGYLFMQADKSITETSNENLNAEDWMNARFL